MFVRDQCILYSISLMSVNRPLVSSFFFIQFWKPSVLHLTSNKRTGLHFSKAICLDIRLNSVYFKTFQRISGKLNRSCLFWASSVCLDWRQQNVQGLKTLRIKQNQKNPKQVASPNNHDKDGAAVHTNGITHVFSIHAIYHFIYFQQAPHTIACYFLLEAQGQVIASSVLLCSNSGNYPLFNYSCCDLFHCTI